MPKPDIPKPTDPENSHFHPVFKTAAEEAIKAKGLSDKISVLSQFRSPTGPIDLVLFNKTSKKVLLPIEIKRSQTDVRGGGRRQARDYWVNLGASRETEFYCVSNLELVELFRNDSARPRTSAQRITLSNPISRHLASTHKKEFYAQLEKTIGEILEIVREEKPAKYTVGLTQFQINLESVLDDLPNWHQLFIPAGFEYIRGASSQLISCKDQIGKWKSASMYHARPNRLVQLGSAIDFSHLFCAPVTNKNHQMAFSDEIMKEVYESGKQRGQGDDIAELVYELLQSLSPPKTPGVVETDAELAQLLAVVAYDALGRELNPNEKAFDPGCGSGKLLTALPLTAFPSILPSQIRANELEPLFSEALSIRLGLAYGANLSPKNAPSITIGDVQDLSSKELENVRLTVMNPPYLSGVQAAACKQSFARRIKKVSGSVAKLNIGQAALELLFLELVWNLLPQESVIATVFPVQHLTRLSDEVVALRKFLIHDFKLTHIVSYPRTGLFESVVKQTILLVGKKGTNVNNDDIKIIGVQHSVGNLDFGELMAGLKARNAQPTYGVQISEIPRKDLLASAQKGWRHVMGAGVRANKFSEQFFSDYPQLEALGKAVRRGVLGNNGNTELTRFPHKNPAHPSVVRLIPNDWIKPAMNTTEQMPRTLTRRNAPELSFLPPPAAYEEKTAERKTLQKIIKKYLLVSKTKPGAQKKNNKSPETILKNLKSNQKDFGSGWVLVQRASRTKGEVCLLENSGILLSTNVPMIKFPTKNERLLFASWMLSIFGQIQLELVSTHQEGMRKLEMNAIKKIRFPNFSSMPRPVEKVLTAHIKTEPALQFSNIQLRPSDHLWAKVVCPTNPAQCLEQAFSLFQELVDERIGMG